MIFNGTTLTAYGTIDTPWTEDFEEVSAKVDAQAAAVEQNAKDIDTLQEETAALQKSVAELNGSTMTAILENAEATEHVFTPADYDILLVGATPATSHRVVCTTIPAATAAAGLEFQVADEESFTKWNLTAAGITRADGTGTLKYIYGIKL